MKKSKQLLDICEAIGSASKWAGSTAKLKQKLMKAVPSLTSIEADVFIGGGDPRNSTNALNKVKDKFSSYIADGTPEENEAFWKSIGSSSKEVYRALAEQGIVDEEDAE